MTPCRHIYLCTYDQGFYTYIYIYYICCCLPHFGLWMFIFFCRSLFVFLRGLVLIMSSSIRCVMFFFFFVFFVFFLSSSLSLSLSKICFRYLTCHSVSKKRQRRIIYYRTAVAEAGNSQREWVFGGWLSVNIGEGVFSCVFFGVMRRGVSSSAMHACICQYGFGGRGGGG